jgi:GNAT superfamily N-acetyltransferase
MTTPLKFQVASQHTPEAGQVCAWLRAYNVEHNPQFMQYREANDAVPLQVAAFEDARLVGGLLGETLLEWLKISIMAVDPSHRRTGIGTALLAEAERAAIERGCRQAYVDTMSYQAPEFYKRCGYKIVGEIPNWDSFGHSKLFLIKTLR